MPGVKVDFIWDWDFVNITATRSQGAPKIAPAWKGPKAPKLPPKPKALPASATPRPASRPKINTTRFQNSSDDKDTPRITDVTDTEDVQKPEAVKSGAKNSALKPTSGNPKKDIPKLKDTATAKTKSVPKAGKA